MITTWYLQSHRTWDRSRHSCIGSPSSPWGPSRRASLCRLTIRGTPDRSKLFGSHGQRPWLHDVVTRIKPRSDLQSGRGRHLTDQVDHHRSTHQGTTAPILREMTEHPVLDLVPLARARREVAHRDREPQEIGQLLDRYLPKP